MWLADLVKHESSYERCDYQTVMENTRASIKKRYKNAYHNIRSKRMYLDSDHARLTTFVKFEKIPIGKMEDGKPPRLIQFRSYEYLYCLKSFILSHSLMLKSTRLTAFFGQELNSVFTKLSNNPGMAKQIRYSWDQFKNPVAICLDHSKFDGHYVTDLLNLEHEYWMKLFTSPFLKRLLEMQLHNKGVTQNGLRYKLKGHRASGEYTTSEGNTLLNYIMIVTVCQHLGIDARIHVNGDDSIIIAEAEHEQAIVNSVELFRHFNMDTGVEKVANHFQEIVYCQASPVRRMMGGELVWMMTKEPYRTMSRACYCEDRYGNAMRRYVAGTALCELAASAGSPMVQQFALTLLDRVRRVRPLGGVDKNPAKYANSGVLTIEPILDVTREDFSIAFGITPEAQIQFELDLAGQISSPQELNNYITRYQNFHLR